MNHFTLKRFWKFFYSLPEHIQEIANKNFSLLKLNPFHPSLHFKEISKDVWSARIGSNYRAVARKSHSKNEFFWFWIGTHEEYNNLLKTVSS